MRPAYIGRLFVRHAVTILTVAALAFVFIGLALESLAAAFVVTGFLLALVTPIGAALRILIRGR
jgi:hypothetical protein